MLISVNAPALSAPLVGILVVPLVVGLGAVGLSLGGDIGLLNEKVLIATPSIPVGVSLLVVERAGGLRGGALALAVA